MGFLARLHDTRGTWMGPISLKDPALARLFGSGYQSASGVVVTAENAFTFSAVFSAVNQISSDVAKLPLNLLKRREDGGSDHYIDSKLYRLLKQQPNPEMVSMVLRRTMVAHALTCHGGYAEIERDNIGRPFAIWLLTPDRVEVTRERAIVQGRQAFGDLQYRIDGDRIIPARDVLHIHGLGYDGYLSYSIIDKARQTIGLALAAEKFGATYFGKGTMFGGWLESDDDLDPEQKDEIRKNIEAFRAAQDSAFRILVTGAGHKFHQFTNKPSESQMDESRIRQVEEVARFFRLPPYRLGINTPGTVSYASVEAANLDYYTGALLDWTTLIEQEFTSKLVPAVEQRQQYIKHNVNAFLRADTKSRADFYNGMLDRGVFSADDVLMLEDMNPQPNGQGKVYLVQGAQIPKNQLIELTAAKIDSEKAKALPPAPVESDPPANDPDATADDAVRAIIARLEAAEIALRDKQTSLQQEREGRIAFESSGSAQAEEIQARRAAEQALVTECQQRMVEVERLRGEKQSAEQTAVDVTTERDALSERLSAVVGDLDAVRAAKDVAEGHVVALTEEARLAQEASDAAVTQAIEVEQLASAAQTSRADEALREAERMAQEATARADAAEANRLSAIADLETLRVEADRLTAEGARLDGELRAGVESTEALALVALAEADRLKVDATTNASAMASLEQERDEARVAVTRAAEAADAVVRTERQAITDRMTAVMAAHRALIVDALGRMTRRETQQARSRQATQEKLRRWLNGFPESHEAICVEAVLPAVRAHLAWRGSDEDAVEATTNLVREHIALFESKLRVTLDADPQDFHVALDRVLTRWETERAEAVADALLVEEIRHVREQ